MISLEDVRAAAARIAPHIRRTPVVAVTQALRPATNAQLWLKLECLQASGSFKARGAMNRLLTTEPAAMAHGIVTASGGNHGVATARASHIARVPTTVFVPEGASALKRAKLAEWGADVHTVGALWDEADKAARAFAAERGAVYFHPFADSAVVAGQGTIALEILEDLRDVSLFLIAIGGGGLAAGMSTVLRALAPSARIVGIEPVGSPTLHASLVAGHVVTLPRVTTKVPTMACGRTDERVYSILSNTLDEIVLIEDADMFDAARWLWFEMGLAADPSGAAAVAALRCGAVRPLPGERVCGLVCGAGAEGMA
jgi:threonine dehydratase